MDRSNSAARQGDARRLAVGRRIRRLMVSIGLLSGISIIGVMGAATPASAQLNESVSSLVAPFTIQGLPDRDAFRSFISTVPETTAA